MTRYGMVVGLMAAGVVALTACADPISGDWRTKKKVACDQRGELVLDDDLNGSGEVPLGCEAKCKFNLEAEETATDRYRFRVTIDNSDECIFDSGKSKAKFDCELEKDGTQLDCGSFHTWKLQDED